MSLLTAYKEKHGDTRTVAQAVSPNRSFRIKAERLPELDEALSEQYPDLGIKSEPVDNTILFAYQDDPKGNVTIYTRPAGKSTHSVVLTGALVDLAFE